MPALPLGLGPDIALCISVSPSALPMLPLLTSLSAAAVEIKAQNGSGVLGQQFYHLPAGSSPLLLLLYQTPVFYKWDNGSRAQVYASPQTSLGISVGAQSRRELWYRKSLGGQPGGRERG